MSNDDQDREMRLANFEKQMRLCSKISNFIIEQTRITDRELLEMAAKAANIEGLNFDRVRRDWAWNPLDDDGDALRLAAQLRLMIAWDRWNDNDYVCIRHRDLDEEIGIQIDQKPEQTVRRAIVRAAAEIGRAMK